MFFRRERLQPVTFEQHQQSLRQAGFTVETAGGGRIRVTRDGCAVVLEDVPGGPPRVAERAGLDIGGAIGVLVDGGFQKFFQTPDRRRKPALAEELKALHRFQEDLREAVGQISLYNESLGTVSTRYMYDRVEDRDRGVPRRAWE